MLASSAPTSFPIPFANNAGTGFIRAIPTASQIGVTPGAASLHDGFVPLNMTPVAAGGVPPFGQDMNGILFESTTAIQWIQAGGLPVYNSTFSTAIGGYPNGAILVMANGKGMWQSTVDNNTSDPDTGGANWAQIAVSLLQVEALIEAMAGNYYLDTGAANAYVITMAPPVTAYTNGMPASFRAAHANTGVSTLNAGGGVVSLLNDVGGALVSGDLLANTVVTAVYDTVAGAFLVKTLVPSQLVTPIQIQQGAFLTASAGGTADAITAAYTPAITALVDEMMLRVCAGSANATTTPTFTPNSGTVTAYTIVKGSNQPLAVGDIPGANAEVILVWDATLTAWKLINPATGVTSSAGNNAVNDFRLTLTSGVPVTTTDVVGATTIYCTPFSGNSIALYSGSVWNTRISAEFSLALGTLTSGRPYDVFCYDNAGVPTLEFLAWTSTTARATAIVYQDGVLVKSGATTRRYMGTFQTTSTTQTEDSESNRFLVNYNNAVVRTGLGTFSTNRSTTSSTYTEINSEIRCYFLIGVQQIPVLASLNGTTGVSPPAGSVGSAIAFDNTTVPSDNLQCLVYNTSTANTALNVTGNSPLLAAGAHYATVVGKVNTASAASWFSANITEASKTYLQIGVMG